jgi:PHS family inorganic phosphate transporter-like MFS transporter
MSSSFPSTLSLILCSYDIFAINIAWRLLGYVSGKGQGWFVFHDKTLLNRDADGKLNGNQEFGLKLATPIGNLFGQIVFGWLADRVGRKRMCEFNDDILLSSELAHSSLFLIDGIELIIMIVSTFAQALCGSLDAVNVIGSLIVWRFIVRLLLVQQLCLSA